MLGITVISYFQLNCNGLRFRSNGSSMSPSAILFLSQDNIVSMIED